MLPHNERMARVREAYRAAHDRFVTRLREANDADVHRTPADGGWSAAQVGWHVAAVDASFAALLSGDVPAAKPVPEGTPVRTWTEIVAGIPPKLEAGKRVQPPPEVRRDDVLEALAASSRQLEAALIGLSQERGEGYAITHPELGTVVLGQIGDWATAHVVRHNAQAKRVLAEASAAAG